MQTNRDPKQRDTACHMRLSSGRSPVDVRLPSGRVQLSGQKKGKRKQRRKKP